MSGRKIASLPESQWTWSVSAVRTPFSWVAVLRAVRMHKHRANRERAFLPAPSAFEIGRVHDGSHDEARAMHVSRIVGVVWRRRDNRQLSVRAHHRCVRQQRGACALNLCDLGKWHFKLKNEAASFE
jgi:hypothetical protein